MVAKGHAFAMSFRRAHSPHAYLLLQEEAALDHEHLLDNRDHDRVALFSDGGHRVDLLADPNPFDFCRLVSEQFVNQLFALVRDPRYPDAPRFDYLL
jgi:hypothetical protein